MTIETSPEAPARSAASVLAHAVRYYLGGRRGLIALGAGALGLGAWFNWGWLVAAGIAPLLMTALPCAAMCVLGLCAMRGGGRSDAGDEPGAAKTMAGELSAKPKE